MKTGDYEKYFVGDGGQTAMRMMPISLCKPGMKLAKNIYSDDGVVLLAEGVELTASLIRRVAEYGISFLYLQDPRTDDIQVPELISEETQRRAMREIRNAFREFSEHPGRRNSVTYPYIGRSMRQVTHMIMEDLSRNEDAMIMLGNMHTVDHYLFTHSLQVCVYATMLGQARGYNNEQLLTLGMGALLHDIGKTQISMQVLLKPGALTHDEREEIKRHAERGYYLLKDEPGIPLLSAHCALQHHERLDGTGYPRGLKAEEIHEYAKLIGIVDSFDAMTNRRVYREAMLPHQAAEKLYAGSGTLYDTELLQLFRDKVAIYPIGIGVRLSTGQNAVVVDINSGSVHRPIVRVLTDEDGQELKEPFDVDLSKTLNIVITGIEFENQDRDSLLPA